MRRNSCNVSPPNCEMDEPVIRVAGAIKRFGGVTAVDRVSFEVGRNEIFGLLGPSGCGKTTLLRLIAGLETPDEGEIFLDGQCVVSATNRRFVPPNRRNIGMVFQSYAIWPHMTVYENVAYPLRARRVKSGLIRDRVSRILALVGLEGIEARLGPQLSGGQQQRVAFARALVHEPRVLLLDEPFSNLDAKLREQMRLQVKLLLERLRITVILVTHDQIEGLGLCDRIAVLNNGQVEQIDRPQQIYERPLSPFVRDFLGNVLLLEGIVDGVAPAGAVRVRLEGIDHVCPVIRQPLEGAFCTGDRVVVAIRPENIRIAEVSHAERGTMSLPGTVETLLFLGDRFECGVKLRNGQTASLHLTGAPAVRPGAKVELDVTEDAISLWRR